MMACSSLKETSLLFINPSNPQVLGNTTEGKTGVFQEAILGRAAVQDCPQTCQSAALLNSEQLWLPAQDLKKTELVRKPAYMEEGLMRPSLWLRRAFCS